MEVSDWITLGVTIPGVVVAFLSVRASLYIRRRQFEDIYIQRYWQLNERIPPELRVQLRTPPPEPTLEDLDPGQLRVLWDYLLLCEDEIDLRATGQVTDETWAIWRDSILFNMRRWPFRQMFEHIEHSYEVHDGGDPNLVPRPITHLRGVYRDTSGEDVGDRALPDPYTAGRLHRWLSGRRERLFGPV